MQSGALRKNRKHFATWLAAKAVCVFDDACSGLAGMADLEIAVESRVVKPAQVAVVYLGTSDRPQDKGAPFNRRRHVWRKKIVHGATDRRFTWGSRRHLEGSTKSKSSQATPSKESVGSGSPRAASTMALSCSRFST